jgi:hypothetical protein
MRKETITLIAVISFAAFMYGVTYLAVQPIFPGFYEQYQSQGHGPLFSWLYAWSTAAKASNWVQYIFIAVLFPYALLVKWIIRRYGK